VPKAEVAKGAEVTVLGAMPMANFESKTLKRKFEVVFFGTLEGAAPPAPPAAAPGGMDGSPAAWPSSTPRRPRGRATSVT